MRKRLISGTAMMTALTVRRAATVLLMMILTAASAWAQNANNELTNYEIGSVEA